MATKFGRELRRLRKERRLSQHEVGQMLGGFSHGRVNHWEKLPSSNLCSNPPKDSAIILKAFALMPVLKTKRGKRDGRKAEIIVYSKRFSIVKAGLLLLQAMHATSEIDVDPDTQKEFNDYLSSIVDEVRHFVNA